MSELNHVDLIRDRYAVERAKRLRADGSAQFDFLDAKIDPWTPPLERAAIDDEVDVIILGGGLGGLAAGAKLRQAGIDRIRVVDRGGDFGGTWYWNRYPAVQCDIESYVYMPLLEELDYIPSMKYVYGDEVLAHCQAIARKYDLYRDAVLQTEVLECVWNDSDQLWTVLTNRGDALRAQFVVIASGILQQPKLPAIKGLSDFQGHMFHTSRWDYDYTGGEPGLKGGGLPNLADKVVGIVGTGATALQAVTPVAEAAKHLYVFQRTPSVVMPRNNKPTDPAWVSGLQPGWQRERMYSFTLHAAGMREVPDLTDDLWTQVYGHVAGTHGAGIFGGPEERRAAELADLEAMDAVRARVAETVQSETTAAALMPYYRLLCKRPGFHDDYLRAFNRPNVTLVDTDGAGVSSVSGRSVVVGDTKYDVDCLILATGFDTGRAMLDIAGIDCVGRSGLRLSDYWKAGPRTLHGIHTRNFPNLFQLGIVQSGPPTNFVHSLVESATQLAYTIEQVRARGFKTVEATEAAEDEWVRGAESSVPAAQKDFLRSCTPGYYNNEGDPIETHRLGGSIYLMSAVGFFDLMREWREEGSLAGLELQR